jgi:hypothetical protein
MPIYPNTRAPLFSELRLDILIKNQQAKMDNIVAQYNDDALLEIPAADLIEACYQEAYLEPLVLSDQGVAHNPREINTVAIGGRMVVGVPAYVYRVDYPYTGASGLFRHQPSTHDTAPPLALLNSDAYRGTIAIEVVASDDIPPDQIKEELKNQFDRAQKYIGFQAIQLDRFNASLREAATALVEGVRNKILRVRQTTAALGYPLVHRPGASMTYASPAVRRRLRVPMPTSATFTPEPAIAEEDYQGILQIIEGLTFVMERSPSTFTKMPEEVLRDHYLVQLNNQYGTSTGETFNGHGKTDILVNDNGRNVFIAECKFWRGPKAATGAIDQLLSYLTWRDTKAALIMFNRNIGFSKVLESLWATVLEHPNYKRGPIQEGASRMRYTFASKDDPNREIHITVMAFDMPSDGSTA